MPTYSMICSECGYTENRRLPFAVYDKMRDGSFVLLCPKCEMKLTVEFAPGDVTFVLRDGPSGGWASKALRENKYRAGHHVVMGKRQRDHVFTPKLQPNYAGEETGTWREAQERARCAGGDATSYNALIPGDK